MSSRGVQGAAPLTGAAPPPTTPRQTPTSAEVRAAYHARLEDQVSKAIEAFKVRISTPSYPSLYTHLPYNLANSHIGPS